jgi:hypothetical protein
MGRYWEMLHTFLHHADTNMDTDPVSFLVYLNT